LHARVNSRDPLLREIAFLKKLKAIPAWKGTVFHSLVSEYFRNIVNNRNIDLADLLEMCKRRINKQWEFSKRNLGRTNIKLINNGIGVALIEHEHGENLPEDILEQVIGDIEGWVRKFKVWENNVGLCKELQKASETWIEPNIFGKEAPGLDIDGIRVITKVDLAFHTNEGEFNIYDWKTGKRYTGQASLLNQADFQAGVYQLWPHTKLGKNLDSVKTHFVYLGEENAPEHRTFTIDENFREHIISLIRKSILRMQHIQGLYNKAKLNLGDLDFARYEKACIYCPFKRICQKELEK